VNLFEGSIFKELFLFLASKKRALSINGQTLAMRYFTTFPFFDYSISFFDWKPDT